MAATTMPPRRRHLAAVTGATNAKQPAGDEPAELAAHLSDDEAAARMTEFHRDIASQMPPESEIRGLILRSATRWSRIGDARRPIGLAAVPDDERRK